MAGVGEASGRKLVLVGFMGAGKSTCARLLAVRFDCAHVDADERIEAELGEPIATFFDREGEAAFREREQQVVLELLGPDGPPIVALGGGAVTSEAVRERLAEHVTIYLEVDAETAWKRARGGDRPLARDRERFEALLARRRPLYESVACAVVPAQRLDDVDRALAAAAKLAEPRAPFGTRMFWGRAESSAYPVFVGDGAASGLGVFWPGSKRCFAIADASVWKLHGERLRAALGAEVELIGPIEVAPGEQSKNLGEAERLLRELARRGMRRDDAVLAIGGGVVGDLAGFCAASYQRGVPIVHVPTTVVAQVDSAYGGKTGVDLPEGKNYVGAFHQPAAVVTDPQLLRSLPAGELSAGYSEVVKTGLIAGGELWHRVVQLGSIVDMDALDPEALTDVIAGCARTKLDVVAADERDHGLRACLNLGHTLAHALESATGYGQFRHGEAVAIGLLAALRISERQLALDPSVRTEVARMLGANGLQTVFTGPGTDQLLDHMGRDKKRSSAGRNFVLLRAVGEIQLGCEVEDELLVEAIEELRQ